MRKLRRRKTPSSNTLIIPPELRKEMEEGICCQIVKEIKEEEVQNEFVFGENSESDIDESRILECMESWRVLLTHARSWTIATLGILAGLLYAATNIITGDSAGITPHSIGSIAPYIVSAIWSFEIFFALRMYYCWPNPLLLNESLDSRVHRTIGPERLMAILSWQFGVGAAVIAVLDSSSMYQSWVTIAGILVFGISAGLFAIKTWGVVDIQKGTEFTKSYVSSGIRWDSKGSSVQQDWQVFWTRRFVVAAGIAPLVLFLAWQLDGHVVYLALGYLAYAALYSFQSCLRQYGRMVEAACALEMLAKHSSDLRRASRATPESRERLLCNRDSENLPFGFDQRNN